MKILYLNNLRGFENTFIPIQDVNFLVGENSTGKSTVLSILKLLSTPQFWSNDDFNMGEVELGSFTELVSNNSSDPTFFEIGYLNDKSDHAYRWLHCRYENKKGESVLQQMRILIENQSVLIDFTSNRLIKIKVKLFEKSKSIEESFKRWVADTNFSKTRPKNILIDDELFVKRPYYNIRSKIRSLAPSIKFEGMARPMFLSLTTWIAPIRSKPRRIYEGFKLVSSGEGSHVPLLIKLILSNQQRELITKRKFTKEIEAFGKQSGLFDKI